VLALTLGLLPSGPAAVANAGARSTGSTKAAAVDAQVVPAANLADFEPGNVIDDAVFFNEGTMSETDIQRFLEARVPRCEAGYTCLKDWYDTSRSTSADAMCGAYSGGMRERASRIIYKVAQACGINPQVILATLQKEQGLVTHVWPSDWRYTSAMGQGCPDTAACDARYYGFFNQVYGAAWQFKRYANPPGTSQYFTWYAPGRTWNVRWHPNAGCGSAPVYIQNQATANLYYYTPYQPNRAALNAGYGEGDACSSYGNRNFYQYFTDWFGYTHVTVTGQIKTFWDAQGGAAGRLGRPTSGQISDPVNGGGIYQRFESGIVVVSGGVVSQLFYNSLIYQHWAKYGGQAGTLGWPRQSEDCALRAGQCFTVFSNGVLGWTASTGVNSIVGANSKVYLAAGGPRSELGIPIGAEQWISPNSGGLRIPLAGGTVYAPAAGTPTVLTSASLIRAAYESAGGPSGSLGWPVMNETCDQGCRVQFQQGLYGWTAAAGVYALDADVFALYRAAGGVAGVYGPPVGPATAISAATPGRQQVFVGGVAYLPQGLPVTILPNTDLIQRYYVGVGGPAGRLGWPRAAEQCASGACRVDYERGVVDYTTSQGINEVAAQSLELARKYGGPTRELGVAIGPAVTSSANGGGYSQQFSGGIVTRTTAGQDAFLTNASLIRKHWQEWGAQASGLGWPTAPETCAAGTCYVDFTKGTVGWSAADGVNSITGARYAAYLSGGGRAVFGIPAGPERFVTGGSVQDFARAVAYTTGGTTSLQMRNSLISARWLASGGTTGAFAWPTAFERCERNVCFTVYQRGVLSWTAAQGVRATTPAKGGAPTVVTAVTSPRGTPGWVIALTGGAAYVTPQVALAEFYNDSLIYRAYATAGGPSGTLGWPTTAERCTSTGCVADFEGGRIDWTPGGGVKVTPIP